MKVGVFTDVHGNLPALSAMLKKFAEADCERIICCGDILGIGPYPEETVQALQKIPGLLAVRGNHDRYLTDGLPAQVPNTAHMCAEEIRHHKRAHSVLSQSSRTFLASLPNRMEIVLAGAGFVSCTMPWTQRSDIFPLWRSPICMIVNGFFRRLRRMWFCMVMTIVRSFIRMKKSCMVTAVLWGVPLGNGMWREAEF